MRNSSNSSAYTGSNTVISRAALEEIGGFPYHTITEDFETSCRLQKAGYLTYASDKVGAHGLTTTDVPAMMRQRVRWARASSPRSRTRTRSSRVSFPQGEDLLPQRLPLLVVLLQSARLHPRADPLRPLRLPSRRLRALAAPHLLAAELHRVRAVDASSPRRCATRSGVSSSTPPSWRPSSSPSSSRRSA